MGVLVVALQVAWLCRAESGSLDGIEAEAHLLNGHRLVRLTRGARCTRWLAPHMTSRESCIGSEDVALLLGWACWTARSAAHTYAIGRFLTSGSKYLTQF